MPTNTDALAAALADAVGAPAGPTPGQRVARGAGQAGGALVLVQLWQAFGWFGADGWTAEEAGVRWPAVTAAVILAVGVIHNVWNYLRPQAVDPATAAAVTATVEATRLEAKVNVEEGVRRLAAAAVADDEVVKAALVESAEAPAGGARMGRARPRVGPG